MTIKCGSGQTNGLPLLLTTAAVALHTAPVGSATAERVRVLCSNVTEIDQVVHLAVYNSSAALVETLDIVVPRGADAVDVLAGKGRGEFVLNGTAVVKGYADAPAALYVMLVVDDQTDVAGIVSQVLCSGLVAAVQAASRYACPAPGAGVGTATIANAQIKMPRAGILRNLRAASDAAVGTTAVVTAAVFINGVASALSLTFANADGTADKINSGSVAVAAGDLVTFGFTTTNVAPVANLQACCELV